MFVNRIYQECSSAHNAVLSRTPQKRPKGMCDYKGAHRALIIYQDAPEILHMCFYDSLGMFKPIFSDFGIFWVCEHPCAPLDRSRKIFKFSWIFGDFWKHSWRFLQFHNDPKRKEKWIYMIVWEILHRYKEEREMNFICFFSKPLILDLASRIWIWDPKYGIWDSIFGIWHFIFGISDSTKFGGFCDFLGGSGSYFGVL